MRLNLCAMTTAALAFAFAGACFAEQVKTDWDRSANFGQYRTYSWERVSTRDPLMVDRIKSAVNAVLTSKGWTEVPSGADAAVVAIETTHNQQTLDTFYDGFGGGSAALGTPRRPLKPTRSAHSWSTSSTLIRRS